MSLNSSLGSSLSQGLFSFCVKANTVILRVAQWIQTNQKEIATESKTIGKFLKKKLILLLSKIHCFFDVSLPKTLSLETETVLSTAL